MKRLILILLLCLPGIIPVAGQTVNAAYDSTLAGQLGADDYGMRRYVLVILKTGGKDVPAGAERDSLFAGHFENINRLEDEGKLVLAGPLEKNDKAYRGIFILKAADFKEVLDLLQADPTVREGIFDVQLFNWYGSAALPEYLKTHKKIEKYRIQ